MFVTNLKETDRKTLSVNNVTMTGNFIVVQQAILQALADEPSAKLKVVEALAAIEDAGGR